MGWLLEQAKFDTSYCKECRIIIRKGEWRFGKNGAKPRYFHLRCAARGAPVMYPPFAKKGQAILDSLPKVTRPVTSGSRRIVGDASAQALPVLADWLQSQGDPWGELIALRLAGKDELAIDHFYEHVESLCGDFDPNDFNWREGLIVEAHVEGQRLADLLSLRTAGRLITLSIGGKVPEGALAQLSEQAPPTLRNLTLRGSAFELDQLALPSLEKLTLEMSAKHVKSLAKARLPSLRELQIESRPSLPLDCLEALLAAPLLRGLKQLVFEDDSLASRTVDNAGLAKLVEGKAALAHVERTYVELAGRELAPVAEKAAKAAFQRRNLKFLKHRRRANEVEEELDLFDLDSTD